MRAPADEGGGPPPERRAFPGLRPAVQAVFDRLLGALRKARRTEVLDLIGGLEQVEDVLRTYPAHAPTFVELAWQLRDQPDFAAFFRVGEGGGSVTDRDTPIAPCGLTFNQIVRAHLQSAARLVFEDREREWAERQAKRETARLLKEREARRKGRLSRRLMNPLKTMLEGDLDVGPDQLRAQYPGYNLYPVLKPYVREPWQFAFIDQYAGFGTAEAHIVGHLVGQVRTPEAVEWLTGLDAESLSVIRAVCRTYAEVTLGLPREKGPRRLLTGVAAKERDEDEARIGLLAKSVLDVLLLRRRVAVDAIRALGLGIRREVRRLTPVYGETVWMVFETEEALANASAIPDHLLRALGPICHRVPPDVSAILGHIRDRTLARDLIGFAREEFSEDELVQYLRDPRRKPIWNSLPAKFNNTYKYQPDAAANSIGAPNNRESLRVICTAVFQSLRLGKLERF